MSTALGLISAWGLSTPPPPPSAPQPVRRAGPCGTKRGPGQLRGLFLGRCPVPPTFKTDCVGPTVPPEGGSARDWQREPQKEGEWPCRQKRRQSSGQRDPKQRCDPKPTSSCEFQKASTNCTKEWLAVKLVLCPLNLSLLCFHSLPGAILFLPSWCRLRGSHIQSHIQMAWKVS